eukprot:SAG22_NODE_600_length_8677_cov_18.222429_6_plen_309_part_00
MVNGGAGNNITSNLIVNGGVGIYNHGDTDEMTCRGVNKEGDHHGQDCRYRAAGPDSGRDFVAGTEGALGVSSYAALFSTPLAKRWPSFSKLLSVNSTRAGWASASSSNFRNNVFLNNSRNICLLTSYYGTLKQPGEHCDEQLPVAGLPEFIDSRGSIEADWSDFPGATGAGLEFVNEKLGFDTTAMGLRCDGWRRSMPDKSKYRSWVKTAFDGVPSFAGNQSIGESQPYTPEAAALRAGLRSGLALINNFSAPCPLAKRRDCAGFWAASGECEADGSGQFMRYTVEVAAVAGGAACAHPDGFLQKRPC